MAPNVRGYTGWWIRVARGAVDEPMRFYCGEPAQTVPDRALANLLCQLFVTGSKDAYQTLAAELAFAKR